VVTVVAVIGKQNLPRRHGSTEKSKADKRLGTPVGRAALLRAQKNVKVEDVTAAVCRGAAEILVEAVGVEPTSENVTGQEPTYLVQFTRRELPRHIRRLR